MSTGVVAEPRSDDRRQRPLAGPLVRPWPRKCAAPPRPWSARTNDPGPRPGAPLRGFAQGARRSGELPSAAGGESRNAATLAAGRRVRDGATPAGPCSLPGVPALIRRAVPAEMADSTRRPAQRRAKKPHPALGLEPASASSASGSNPVDHRRRRLQHDQQGTSRFVVGRPGSRFPPDARGSPGPQAGLPRHPVRASSALRAGQPSKPFPPALNGHDPWTGAPGVTVTAQRQAVVGPRSPDLEKVVTMRSHLGLHAKGGHRKNLRRPTDDGR